MQKGSNEWPGLLPQELVRRVGIGSDTGDRVIRDLEDELARVLTPSRIINEWRRYIGSDEDRNENGAGDTGGGRRQEQESLFCRQVYYSIVVLMTAWAYLDRQRRADLDLKELGIESLLSGQAFEARGISNLSLAGAPTGLGLGLEGMTPSFAMLLELLWEMDWESQTPGDLFRPLYENLIPASARHDLGEHYTPEWLASHMLDQVGYRGGAGETLIDPACGSGVFLLEALSRRRIKNGSMNDWAAVAGLDVNPLAVLAAKVNYLIAAGYRVGAAELLEIPVYLCDVVLSEEEGLWSEPGPLGGDAKFDFVVGNPPWINWESLSPEYRRETLGFWKRYGLFSHSGMDVILGQGKKDFSTLMTLVSAHRFLKPEGKMAFLITQGVFKSGGAAAGFRSFSLPDGAKLQVLLVEDLSRCRPFAGASNRTAVLYLRKGQPTRYPVPYHLWTSLSSDNTGSGDSALKLMAAPVDPDDLRSPWLTCPEGGREGLRKLMGRSEYTAREGANTGGANGILWVEVLDRPRPGLVRVRNLAESSRKKIPATEAVIEDSLVYPLLKGVDVARWRAVPSTHIILTQDPSTRRGISLIIMARNYPRTLDYLKNFERELSNRAAYRRYFKDKDPFYTMFDVGEYTLAPYKTVWRRFGDRMKAAAVESVDKPVIPQETHTMVACKSREEAWYLAGILNSLPVEYALSSYSMVGGKSFAGPNLLNFIRIPLYTGSGPQNKIAEQARRAAAGAAADSALSEAVARYYGINPTQLQEMKQGWEELGLSKHKGH